MNLHPRQPEQIGIQNFAGQFRQIATDRDESMRSDDTLELGDEHTSHAREVEDANIPASSVFLLGVRDVVSRNLAQRFRWECVYSHFGKLPLPHKARKHRNTFCDRCVRDTTSRYSTAHTFPRSVADLSHHSKVLREFPCIGTRDLSVVLRSAA